MGDVRLHAGFLNHPKTIKLKRRCGAIGVLGFQALWIYCAESRPFGDLSGMDDEDIEIAAGWDGEPGLLVGSLAAVGYLDGEPMARRVHDWKEHQPWVAGHKRRSKQGQLAALRRWHKKGHHSDMPDECCPLCRKHDDVIPDANGTIPDANGNANSTEEQCPDSDSDSDSDSVTTTSAPSLDEPTTTPPVTPVLTYPCNGKPQAWDLTAEQVEHWGELFPGLDVTAEARKALAWIEASPTKRKTARGMPRFLTAWLGRCNDRPKRNGNHPQRTSIPITTTYSRDAKDWQ